MSATGDRNRTPDGRNRRSLRSQVNQRSRSRSPVLSSSSELQVMQMPQRRRTRAMTRMIQGESQGLGLGLGLGLSLGLSLGFSLGLSLSRLDATASIPVAQHTTQSSIAIQDPEQQAEEVVEKEPAEEIIAQITDVREITKYEYEHWNEDNEDFVIKKEMKTEEKNKKENEKQGGLA
ncbi:uncharacterized protein LOC144371612 [Ictidomys tridecemlineatus]|nr:hypothetical protein H1C71_031101 [Ictidomys tridecemlineatus]